MSLLKMNHDLKGRDFLSLKDFTSEELTHLLDLADAIKDKVKKGEPYEVLKGKTLGLIFEKSSTRTRVSFEVGMVQLGGYPLFLSSNDLQMGRGEPIKDTARVLSRYLDGIMIRTYSHQDVEELAEYASIPVINGLTDALHPCQVLADLETIREHKGPNLKGMKLAYIGDGNNMAHSLMIGGAKMGMEIYVASPGAYSPDPHWVDVAKGIALENGGKIIITSDMEEASNGADVLYADVWASMGQEGEAEKRRKALAQYQINGNLLKKAAKDVIVMHCLPAHIGEEITEEVFEGPHSVVFDEAENRLHAQKAILASLL